TQGSRNDRPCRFSRGCATQAKSRPGFLGREVEGVLRRQIRRNRHCRKSGGRVCHLRTLERCGWENRRKPLLLHAQASSVEAGLGDGSRRLQRKVFGTSPTWDSI